MVADCGSDTSMCGDKLHMIPVTKPSRLGQREDALIDRWGPRALPWPLSAGHQFTNSRPHWMSIGASETECQKASTRYSKRNRSMFKEKSKRSPKPKSVQSIILDFGQRSYPYCVLWILVNHKSPFDDFKSPRSLSRASCVDGPR